MLNKGLSH